MSAPLWSFQFLRWWAVTNVIHHGDNIFVDYLLGTFLKTSFLRSLGYKIGKDTYAYMRSAVEADLIKIGDQAVIDWSTIIGHNFDKLRLQMAEITMKNRASSGYIAVLLPDSSLQMETTLLPLSATLVGEEFPPNSTWRGCPAELVPLSDGSLQIIVQ